MVELIGLAPIVGSYRHKPVAEKVGEGKVLDVGCGRGELLARLRSQRRELYGFDLSATAAKVAKTICKDTNFFVADARYIPFKSNTFDYIICTEVLEHIEGDDAIRECHRVLKPNGSALFTIPNERGIWGVPQHRGGHVRQFTFKSFCLLSGTAKFEIVSGYGYGLYIPIFSHLFLLIAAVFKRKLPLAGPLNIKVPEFLATNFLIECRKPPI
jgi:ubiquinone/menaquinone biosynthesis C-methylase UbiE